jgi:thiol-disulfide isomerase/thioredoxin
MFNILLSIPIFLERRDLDLRPLPLMIIAFTLMLVLAFGANLAITKNSDNNSSLPDVDPEEISSEALSLGASASSGIKVYFFYGINCPHCAAIEPYIDSMEKKYPQVTFLRYEVTQNSANWDLYQDFNHRYNVKKQLIPSVFIGDKALIAEDAIRANLEPTIKAMLAEQNDNPEPTPTIKKPGAPTSLTSMAGDAQVTLSWKAPSSNGGAAIDYYVVYQNGKDVAHVKATSTVVKGLSNGVTYSFAIAAHNSAGIGTLSSTVKATPHTSVQTPGAPSSLKASPGDGEVRLSWNKPADDGGAAINYYVVYQNGKDVAHVTTTSTVVKGLNNGVTYSFAIAAHNSAGIGTLSSTVKASPHALIQTSGAPTALRASPGDGEVRLYWDEPADDGGAAIDYYIVYQDGNDVAHVNGATAKVTGLTNGVQYSFAVAAHNSAGLGVKSNPVSVTPSLLVVAPGAPMNLTAVPSLGQVQLTWNAPANDGGAAITGYNLSWSLDPNGTFAFLLLSETSYVHEGLENSTTIYYRVSAINEVGEGEKCEVVSVTTLSPSILSPGSTDLSASVINGSISLYWNAPVGEESNITGYNIYRGENQTALEYLASTTGTEFLDGDVQRNMTYYYEVRALEKSGEGSIIGSVNVSTAVGVDQGTTQAFFDTAAGQVALVGLALCGVGIVGYGLWNRRRS